MSTDTAPEREPNPLVYAWRWFQARRESNASGWQPPGWVVVIISAALWCASGAIAMDTWIAWRGGDHAAPAPEPVDPDTAQDLGDTARRFGCRVDPADRDAEAVMIAMAIKSALQHSTARDSKQLMADVRAQVTDALDQHADDWQDWSASMATQFWIQRNAGALTTVAECRAALTAIGRAMAKPLDCGSDA